MLTHDPVEAARYEADPLIFSQIAINVLLDLHDTARRLLADAGAIQVPLINQSGGIINANVRRSLWRSKSSSTGACSKRATARSCSLHHPCAVPAA
jgi:alpha-beta hydrolase superfamily lysophospholipase